MTLIVIDTFDFSATDLLNQTDLKRFLKLARFLRKTGRGSESHSRFGREINCIRSRVIVRFPPTTFGAHAHIVWKKKRGRIISAPLRIRAAVYFRTRVIGLTGHTEQHIITRARSIFAKTLINLFVEFVYFVIFFFFTFLRFYDGPAAALGHRTRQDRRDGSDHRTRQDRRPDATRVE